jgi:F0F1-type ATP synthase membrane subunit b/b'
MNILDQLGINHTYFFQLGIFIFALIVLSQFVFKDFVDLLSKREEKSKGTEGIAAEEHKKAAELQRAYEDSARGLSGEIKTIFDSYRQQAAAEYESIVSKARQESMRLVEDTRQRVSAEIGDAAKSLKEEAPAVALAISGRLLSKEVGAKK